MANSLGESEADKTLMENIAALPCEVRHEIAWRLDCQYAAAIPPDAKFFWKNYVPPRSITTFANNPALWRRFEEVYPRDSPSIGVDDTVAFGDLSDIIDAYTIPTDTRWTKNVVLQHRGRFRKVHTPRRRFTPGRYRLHQTLTTPVDCHPPWLPRFTARGYVFCQSNLDPLKIMDYVTSSRISPNLLRDTYRYMGSCDWITASNYDNTRLTYDTRGGYRVTEKDVKFTRMGALGDSVREVVCNTTLAHRLQSILKVELGSIRFFAVDPQRIINEHVLVRKVSSTVCAILQMKSEAVLALCFVGNTHTHWKHWDRGCFLTRGAGRDECYAFVFNEYIFNNTRVQYTRYRDRSDGNDTLFDGIVPNPEFLFSL